MKWDRIEGNREEFRGKHNLQWDGLSDAQLDIIAGKRALLAEGIEETYGVTKHAAQWQLSGWQQRQRAIALPA